MPNQWTGPRPLLDRFWEKVAKDGDGCWEWRARTNGRYGQLTEGGRPHLAHRLAWELAHGPIPDGLCVLHRCDNPLCVKLEHLFLGTQVENLADMRAKGRGTNPPQNRGRHRRACATVGSSCGCYD